MMLGVVALLVIVIGGAAALTLPGALSAEVLPTPDYAATFAANAGRTPTPFSGSERVIHDDFSISIPAAPEWTAAAEETSDGRSVTTWQKADNTGRISVVLIDAEANSETDFGQAVQAYHQQHYANDARLNTIDEVSAPDGTIRHSFRLNDPQSNPVPSGQLDVFYLWDDSDLAILEVYAADSAGDELVPVFQAVLDSLRLSD